MTVAFEARNRLDALARGGREYQRYEVVDTDGNDTRARDVFAAGYDVTRGIQVILDGAMIAALVEFRLLKLVSGDIVVRIWLKWESAYGTHRSFVSCELSDNLLHRLEAAPNGVLREWELVEVTFDELMSQQGESDNASEEADSATPGLVWRQDYPNVDLRVARYHARFVQKAVSTDRRWLGLLSGDDGSISIATLIDLSLRLRESDLRPDAV